MSAEEKTLLATIAHCEMLKEQCQKRLKMLHDESGAVSTAPARKGRGVPIAEKERIIARRRKRFTQN